MKVKGSLLISALLALFVSSMAYLLLANGLRVIANSGAEPWMVQNAIDIALLQQRMIYASEFRVTDDRLTFSSEGKTWELKQIDDHLVLTPGSQYFASCIDELSFRINGSTIECTLVQDDVERIIALAYVE